MNKPDKNKRLINIALGEVLILGPQLWKKHFKLGAISDDLEKRLKNELEKREPSLEAVIYTKSKLYEIIKRDKTTEPTILDVIDHINNMEEDIFDE